MKWEVVFIRICETKHNFDNITNSSEKESTDGKSTEIEHILNHEMSENEIQSILYKTWDIIFPPVKGEDIKGEWYAIIYMSKKIPHTFILHLQ